MSLAPWSTATIKSGQLSGADRSGLRGCGRFREHPRVADCGIDRIPHPNGCRFCNAPLISTPEHSDGIWSDESLLALTRSQ